MTPTPRRIYAPMGLGLSRYSLLLTASMRSALLSLDGEQGSTLLRYRPKLRRLLKRAELIRPAGRRRLDGRPIYGLTRRGSRAVAEIRRHAS